MAALPRARVRLLPRHDPVHRAGQHQGRREQAPARGGDLNEACREIAARYCAAVMPARARGPHDKPSVENEIWQAAAIAAALCGIASADANALGRAVAERPEERNSRPFSKLERERRQVFEEQKRPCSGHCPPRPTRSANGSTGARRGATATSPTGGTYGSVSHLVVDKAVALRVAESTVEAFLNGEHLAAHSLFPAYTRNRRSAYASDIPEEKAYDKRDAGRYRRWADRVGPSCREAVDRMVQRIELNERGFSAAPAVLLPSRRWVPSRICAL